MVTGDTNAPRFPQPAVRWITPPEDIGVLVAEAGRTRFVAELFHFGTEPRAMSAELQQLAPGTYNVRLLVDGQPTGEKAPSLQVEQGKPALTELTLPARQRCVLEVQK
jgi:hypothetical protein